VFQILALSLSVVATIALNLSWHLFL